MGVLEQVSQLKSQNMSEGEIVDRLKQQGIPPKDINDAFNQLEIKNAVYPQEVPSPEQIPMPEEEATYTPQTKEIEQVPQPEAYAPQPQEEYAAPQEVYQPEAYGYAQQGTYDSDTMVEIAEQVFIEKIKKIEKQIDKIEEILTLLQTQVEHNAERVKRTELLIDKLEVAILERVGSYGRNLETIKKEMQMIEDSFSKIVPSAKKIEHKTTKSSKKK